MSFNGSGTFLINSTGQPVVANTVISATVFNALTADLASGLTNCITKDGQSTPTANIPMGSNKITGLANGTLINDAATLGQVQTTAAKLITSVSGADTVTGIMSPTLTAYAAGQLFYFVAAGANTGAVTLNIDGLGAKAVTRDGASALAAGDINSGEMVVVIYDGTRFQMINAANSFGNTTINGTLTVTGNTALQANVSITSALSVHGTFNVSGAAALGSTLAVTGKSDLPTVSTASINAAVAVVTTGTVTNLTSTSASIASVNAGVALLTNATVTNLQVTGASIASANIGNLSLAGVSVASANFGVAVVTDLRATGASVTSANVGTAVITTGTVTNLTVTGASIASANIGNLQFTAASIASINAGVAVVTNLTATSASIASANVGTAVVTTGTVTNLTSTSASIASANAAVALVTTGTVTNLTSTAASIASANLGTAVVTTGTVTNLTATSASIASANVGTALVTRLDVTGASAASMNANVALLTTATVTNLTATGASIASANVGTIALTRLDVNAASVASANAAVANVTDLRVAGASITSANVGTALVTRLDVTGASAASINANVALITTGTVTNLTSTAASIASANVGTAVITTGTVTNLTATNASVASANVGTAVVTNGTVTNLTATSASIASANAGTAVVTNLTATGASIASANVGTGVVTTLTATQASVGSINAAVALVTDGTVTTLSGTQASITSINHAVVRLLGSSSGYVGLQGAAAAGSTTYTLPSADGSSGQVLTTNGSATLSWTTAGGGGGTGDVVGPASATDNAITRFDQTTGKLIQNSTVILDDAGTITGVASLAAVTASITSANAATAVITTLTVTGASIASANMALGVFNDGTSTAPSITNNGDTNTGAYFPAADEMAVTTGGTVAAAFNSNGLFFRNRIINGDMRIAQRGAGPFTGPSSDFPADRTFVANSTDGAYSTIQDTVAPGGFVNSIKVTITTADTSLTTTQLLQVTQAIEGTNISDLEWGTASARSVTLSFWVRSSLTGTFAGSLRNSGNARSYVFNYSISAANTWEYKTVTIPGDTSGTWLTTTGLGINLTFSLGAGPDRTGTAGSWSGSNLVSSSGAVSVVGTLNATWYITGVQLETGSVATPFERRPYGTELMLCQRYFEKGSFVSATAINTGGIYPSFPFKVTKRVAAASCTSTNSRSLTLAIINDDSTSGLASSIYQNSNDSAANITYFTVSAEL